MTDSEHNAYSQKGLKDNFSQATKTGSQLKPNSETSIGDVNKNNASPDANINQTPTVNTKEQGTNPHTDAILQEIWRLNPQDPGYNPEQAKQLAEKFLAEGGKLSHLKDVAEKHPELRKYLMVKQVDSVKEVLELNEPFEKETNEDGEIVVKTKSGKEIKVTEMGVVAALLFASDLILFGGRNTAMLLDSIGRRFAMEGARKYLRRIGFKDTDLGSDGVNKMYDKFLSSTDTPGLIRMFEQFEPGQMFNFLNEMKPEKIHNLLTGKNFGGDGLLATQHTLTPEQIDLVLKKLTQSERQILEEKMKLVNLALPKKAA